MFEAIAAMFIWILSADYGECTCCSLGRPIYRHGGDSEEWAHVETGYYAQTCHIHWEESSSDCDGSYYNSHIYRLGDMRFDPPSCVANPETWEPTDFDLWELVYSFIPNRGTVSVEVRDDRAWFSSTHDEGGRGGEIRLCHDWLCPVEESDQHRDYRAESMGH